MNDRIKRVSRLSAMFALLTLMVISTAGWRVGNEVIMEGDTMPQVIEAAGEPDQRYRIESRFGGTVGQRWYYVFEGYNARTVIITFKGGRVVSIETRSD